MRNKETRRRRAETLAKLGWGRYFELLQPIYAALSCMGFVPHGCRAAWYVLPEHEEPDVINYLRCTTYVPERDAYQGSRTGDPKNVVEVQSPTHVVPIITGHWNERECEAAYRCRDDYRFGTVEYLDYAKYVSHNLARRARLGMTFSSYVAGSLTGPVKTRLESVLQEYVIFDTAIEKVLKGADKVLRIDSTARYPHQVEEAYLRTRARLRTFDMPIEMLDMALLMWDEYYRNTEESKRWRLNRGHVDVWYEERREEIGRRTYDEPILPDIRQDTGSGESKIDRAIREATQRNEIDMSWSDDTE